MRGECGGTVDRINLGLVGCPPLRSGRSGCDADSMRNDNSRFNSGFDHFTIIAATVFLSEESQEAAPDAMDGTRKKTCKSRAISVWPAASKLETVTYRPCLPGAITVPTF